MKNKFIVLAVLAIMCFSLVFAVACGDNYTQLKAKDENLGNYEGLEVAEDSALTISLWRRIKTGAMTKITSGTNIFLSRRAFSLRETLILSER